MSSKPKNYKCELCDCLYVHCGCMDRNDQNKKWEKYLKDKYVIDNDKLTIKTITDNLFAQLECFNKFTSNLLSRRKFCYYLARNLIKRIKNEI